MSHARTGACASIDLTDMRVVYMKNLFAGCIALTVVALSVTGCRLGSESDVIDLQTDSENTIVACSDGIDNDGNGLIDCDDPGCTETMGTADAPGPGMTVCAKTENNTYTCSDGIDNDGNGYVDCNDNSCKQLSVCCIKSGTEGTTIESCSDGIDNDCNRYVDCNDKACYNSSVPEVKEYCQKLRCPGSVSAEGDCDSEDKTTEECLLQALQSCADNKDNDCNGYTDCQDYSCSKSSISGVAAYCTLVNGADASTVTNETVLEFYQKYGITKPVAENTPELCQDGVDNDFNGLTDCEDPGCIALNLDYCNDISPEPPARPAGFANASAEVRREQLIAELEACTDGIDNNKNGRVDCDEYQCQLLSLQKLEGDEAKYQINCQNLHDSE